MNKLLKIIFASGIFALVSVAPLPVYSADVSTDQAIVAPTTAAEHEAVANRYESEANDLQAKIAEHKNMSSGYRSMGKGGGAGLASHCDQLIKAYEKAEKESRDLAKLHHKMATQAKT